MFEMVQNDGLVKMVWAYGIDKIMEAPDPVDLFPIRKLFPHLPREVFVSVAKKKLIS